MQSAWSGLNWTQLWDRRQDEFTVQEQINLRKRAPRASQGLHLDSLELDIYIYVVLLAAVKPDDT